MDVISHLCAHSAVATAPAMPQPSFSGVQSHHGCIPTLQRRSSSRGERPRSTANQGAINLGQNTRQYVGCTSIATVTTPATLASRPWSSRHGGWRGMLKVGGRTRRGTVAPLGSSGGGARRCCAAAVYGSQATQVSSSDLETRISVARNTGALDLSDCGLEEIPREVFELCELTDLSLAGNRITRLPPDIGCLTQLRRLGLAGNRLEEVPAELAHCVSLEGLWLHGNLLCSLPTEVGRLQSLRFLALAGNCLQHLPDSISCLHGLQVLSVAGNQLQYLPEDIGGLANLRVLAAYGNELSELPSTLAGLTSLSDLWLQGNHLQRLPASFSGLRSLRQLSLADNALESADVASLNGMPALETVWLYGNQLTTVPQALLTDASHSTSRKLANLWLESNPIDTSSLAQLLSSPSPHMKAIGVDDVQVASLPAALRQQCFAAGSGSSSRSSSGVGQGSQRIPVRIGRVAGTGVAACGGGGYFKVQPWSEGEPQRRRQADVLVVAFGSAPGVPNWGGLLRKVRTLHTSSSSSSSSSSPSSSSRSSFSSSHTQPSPSPPPFDTLFVVDPARSWYTHAPLNLHPSNTRTPPSSSPSPSLSPSSWPSSQSSWPSSPSPSLAYSAQLSLASSSAWTSAPLELQGRSEESYYRRELAAAVAGYSKVVMLGDSMGASASLMFADLADRVIAFCPQVDLGSASIRPGRSTPWLNSFEAALTASVRHAVQIPVGMEQQQQLRSRQRRQGQEAAKVWVHCGSWSHDVDQARMLEARVPQVSVTVHGVDSHRLAKDLDGNGKLSCIVADAITS